MNKILLVSKREFLTRVQKKTFLLTTILLPLIIFGFYAMIIYFSVSTGSTLNIAVADNANIFNREIKNLGAKIISATNYSVRLIRSWWLVQDKKRIKNS